MRTINSILRNKSKTSCNFLLITGELKSEPLLMANHFNNHFIAITDKLLHTLPTGTSDYCDYLNFASAQYIYVWLTSISKIEYKLQKIKNELSAGIDQMPIKVLKAILDNILIALSHLFNLSPSKGVHIFIQTDQSMSSFQKKQSS